MISHAKDAVFKRDGLRSFFEYRDLDLVGLTEGRIEAHITRCSAAQQGSTGRHYHTMDAQLLYLIRGTARVDFEGVGVVTLEAGDFLHVPNGLVHDVIEVSADYELLSIHIPAKFATIAVETPAATTGAPN